MCRCVNSPHKNDYFQGLSWTISIFKFLPNQNLNSMATKDIKISLDTCGLASDLPVIIC